MFKLVGEEQFRFGKADDQHVGVVAILPDRMNYRLGVSFDHMSGIAAVSCLPRVCTFSSPYAAPAQLQIYPEH